VRDPHRTVEHAKGGVGASPEELRELLRRVNDLEKGLKQTQGQRDEAQAKLRELRMAIMHAEDLADEHGLGGLSVVSELVQPLIDKVVNACRRRDSRLLGPSGRGG
jgi:hypothetical protein